MGSDHSRQTGDIPAASHRSSSDSTRMAEDTGTLKAERLEKPPLGRPWTRGSLARWKNDTLGLARRRHLLAACSTVQARLTCDGPQTQPACGCEHYASVSIGVPTPVPGRRTRFTGYYPILVESNDPGVLAWARATFPTGIDGVPVVIRECHPPVLQARIGACLSHADNRANFGTLGCFLRRDDQIFALTAAHVVTLGADMVKVGAEVVSPSHARSFLLKQAQLLGTIEQMASDQDACLIGLTPEQSARARNDIPRRKGPKPLRCLAGNGLSKSAGKDGTVIWDDGWAVVGLRVAKVGAAKGNYRVGHVHKVKQDISFTDGATLKGLFTVRSGDGRVFSEGGDSGSVVFEDSGRRPVGLLLGGNGAESVCAEFNDILYTLDADLM